MILNKKIIKKTLMVSLMEAIFLRPVRSMSNVGLGRKEEIDWRDVISEAEQIVGYPTSFLNLRWLFNDEIANTAVHLRKLVRTMRL